MTIVEEKKKIRTHFKQNRDEYVKRFNGQIQFADWYHDEYIIKGNYELYLLDVDDLIYDFLLVLWIGEMGRIRYYANHEVNREKARLMYHERKAVLQCQNANHVLQT